MNFEKHAYLLTVIESLDRADVPTDKSHIQKTLFLISEATASSVPFEFIYRNGPYSYDVDAELSQMRSYAAVNTVTLQGIGSVFCPDRNAAMLREKHPLASAEVKRIEQVCDFVGSVGKPPIELDRQATVTWIRKREGVDDVEEMIKRFQSLKPHASREEITKASDLVYDLFRSAQTFSDRTVGSHAKS